MANPFKGARGAAYKLRKVLQMSKRSESRVDAPHNAQLKSCIIYNGEIKTTFESIYIRFRRGVKIGEKANAVP